MVPNDRALGALSVVATVHLEAGPVFARRVPDWMCVTTRHGFEAARALRVRPRALHPIRVDAQVRVA